MQQKEVKITFQPSGRSVFVLPGTPLLEAAGLAGIILQTPCGGKGTCGKCRVRIVRGETGAAADGACLACQTRAAGDQVVEVPEESMFESRQQILVADAGTHGELDPAIRKIPFALAPPTLADARSDRRRLLDAIGDVDVASDFTRELPGFLRANGWRGTAVASGRRLIALEAGDTAASLLGVAFDIGTTTVVGTLVDLRTGHELAVESRMNGQIVYGDDVISRVLRVRERPSALQRLQEAIVQTLNDIVKDLAETARVSPNHIYEISVAGNSTMQQLLCGFDPSALGEVPFVQVFEEAQTLPARRLGLAVNPGADVYVMPQIGGFVGGDTVAGMVAARLDQWGHPVLLVDIGTNGEIVLAHDHTLLAASAAAGPAFEGARIRQGMRATAGAIEKVIIDRDVTLNVIGNVRPAGICGTALIDAAAGLLRAGILDPTGRILPAEELPDGVPPALRERLRTEDGNTHFVLATAAETASGEPILLWQRDARELQLATAAIRAAIQILLRRAGLEAADLGVVLLAGAFGNFIRRSNARRIGLLPQIPCERIRFIGNAASLGAKLALRSVGERRYAEALRLATRHVDLSSDADFQGAFAEAMLFPERELDACDCEG